MNLVMSGLWFYVYNELLGFGVCFFFNCGLASLEIAGLTQKNGMFFPGFED